MVLTVPDVGRCRTTSLLEPNHPPHSSIKSAPHSKSPAIPRKTSLNAHSTSVLPHKTEEVCKEEAFFGCVAQRSQALVENTIAFYWEHETLLPHPPRKKKKSNGHRKTSATQVTRFPDTCMALTTQEGEQEDARPIHGLPQGRQCERIDVS